MPKNCLNGGWAFSLFAMVVSFIVTLFSLFRLLEAREKVPGGTYSDIAQAALGLPGKYLLEALLPLMLYGFIVAFSFFTIVNLQSVAQALFDVSVS